MSVYYRKNDVWSSVFVSVNIESLGELNSIVEEKVRTQQNIKPQSKKWKAIDIVDTVIVGTNFNPNRNETTIDMIIHVADMTGKAL